MVASRIASRGRYHARRTPASAEPPGSAALLFHPRTISLRLLSELRVERSQPRCRRARATGHLARRIVLTSQGNLRRTCAAVVSSAAGGGRRGPPAGGPAPRGRPPPPPPPPGRGPRAVPPRPHRRAPG